MITGYGATIIDGAWLTLQLALLSMPLVIALDLLGMTLRLSSVHWLAWCGGLYATIVRGIPDLVLILPIFYSNRGLSNQVTLQLGYDDHIDLNPPASDAGALSFIFGTYLSETFRDTFIAIPEGQGGAGYAYSMSHRQVFFRIQVPWMIRLAIPGFTNDWLVLVKATALTSVVDPQDMTFKAKQASNATRESFTYYPAVAGLYLLVTSMSLLLLRLLERRYSVSVRTAEL